MEGLNGLRDLLSHLFKFGDFKIFFEILRTSNMLIVRKVTLYGKIIFLLEEIVYIRIDYTGLFKGRSFIMIRVYLTALNVILNSITFRIAILVNFTKRVLKIVKGIYIVTIYKCVNIMYLMVGNSGVFIVLIVISVTIFV